MQAFSRRLRRTLNRFWSDYGYNRGDTVLRNLPEIFSIEATNHCNLRCVMCPRGEPDIMTRPLGNITDELLKKILDQDVLYWEPLWFHFMGEPLLHPNLFEQIAYVKERGVPKVGISTNATLLTEERARKILDSGLDSIVIAVDGIVKETYEQIRKSPKFTYEDVIENVGRFLDLKRSLGRKKPYAILSIIAMEETRAQIQEFKKYWKSRGADEVVAKQYSVWANQADEFANLAPLEQRTFLAQHQRAYPCNSMWKSLVITWDGLVLPCCYDYDAKLVLGDLKTQSLREIWNGEAYVKLRERELAKQNDHPLCRQCTQAPGYARSPRWPALRATLSQIHSAVKNVSENLNF